jgi:putative ABC transport system permease protein
VFASSATASVDQELSRGLRGEFVIQSNAFDVGIPAELRGEIAELDGVDTVASFRQGFARITRSDGDTANVFLGAIDPAVFASVVESRMDEGELSDLRPGTIVLDAQTAEDDGVAIGDRLTVAFATGETAEFTVSALSDDPFLLGTYTITLQDWAASGAVDTDAMLFVDTADGADPEALDSQITRLAEPYPTVQVQDRDEFMGSVADQLNQLLNVVYGLLALSVFIALLGIANTLSLSIHERTRELGLLRAVGMTRGQLRSTVRWEAVIIALIGTALGLILGVGLSYVLVRALSAQGFSRFEVPGTSLVVIAVVFAVLGVLASVLPARRAARLDVLRAIEAT